MENNQNSKEKKSGFHYGYLIVIAVCAGVVPVSLSLSCTGLLFTPIAESMGVGAGLISNYMTTLMLVAAVWLPFAGKLFAKIDARIITSISAAAIGLGLIFCSFATAPWMIFVGGGINGFGVATLLYLMGPVLINRWFAKRAGFFIGVGTAFMGVATAVLSPIIGSLLLSVGWSQTFLIMGIIALVVSLPFTLFVIRSFPSDKNLAPYGASAQDAKTAGDPSSLPGLTRAQAMKTPAFYLLCAFVFVICLGLYTQSMNPNYIKQLAISESVPMLFSMAASVLMVAQVVAKLLIGATAEKKPLIVGIVVMAFGIAGFAFNLVFANSMAMILVASGCIGVCTALANVYIPILTRRFFGNRDYGSIYSIFGTVMSIAGVLQALVLGTLLDATSFVVLEIAFIVLAAVAIVILFAVIAAGDKTAKEHDLLD